jgi:hypothetical protein
MCPDTNWETYVAAQKDAEEERRRAVAARKEEYERQSNAIHEQRLRRQRETLGFEEYLQQVHRHNNEGPFHY